MITIETVIDLTSSDYNIEPRNVNYLHMVNEPNNKLVQYFIEGDTLKDKTTLIQNGEYETAQWKGLNQKITLSDVSNFGVKAFPGLGAIAHYKRNYENKNMILYCVNHQRMEKQAPSIATVISGNKMTFQITDPTGVKYESYRIVIVYSDDTKKEYISYVKTFEVPKPIKDIKNIYCVGYIGEAADFSYNSADSEITVEEVSG